MRVSLGLDKCDACLIWPWESMARARESSQHADVLPRPAARLPGRGSSLPFAELCQLPQRVLTLSPQPASVMAAHDPDHASSEKADDAPQTAVDAASVITPPPPESSASITTRRLVIMSFWAVAILLGLPLWFKTTTIYRADLPLQQMLDWADGKVLRA